MLLRYSGSIGGGTVMAAALIYVMQLLIGPGDEDYTPPIRFHLPVAMPRIVEPPPPPVPNRPPDRPTPRETTTAAVVDSPQTVSTASLDLPLAVPGPAAVPDGSAPGNSRWLGNTDVVAVARIEPIYPRAALSDELEGRVVVEFTVTAGGRVADARVIESSHPVFERPALAAVARFRYQPRIIDGKRIAVTGQRTEFAFRIED